MQRYLVQCWIKPQSGFDLARKNRIMKMLRELMSTNTPDDAELEKAVEAFEKEHEGYILEPIVLESDKEVTDAEKELMPEIRKTYPEAKLFSMEPVPQLT